MNSCSQFVKDYVNLTKNPLDTFLVVIVQFIYRVTLMTHLLWLAQLFHKRRNLHISTQAHNLVKICNLYTMEEPTNIYKFLNFCEF